MASTVVTSVLELEGMTFTVRSAGLDNAGELIILLHGFPETSLMWELTMEKMAALGYRCIAPDMRGYSRGARPKGYEHYTFRELAKDILNFAQLYNGEGKFHLVGHDVGAALGWNIVTLYPEKIQSWTALSVPHWPAYKWAMSNDPVQKEKGSYVGRFMEPEVPEAMLAKDDYAVLRGLWKGFKTETINAYLSVFSQYEAREAVINWYRGMMLSNEAINYGSIETPTKFIWGNQDLAIGEAGIKKSHEYMKGYYEFNELNAGHWLLEFNGDEVSELMIDHIQKFPVL